MTPAGACTSLTSRINGMAIHVYRTALDDDLSFSFLHGSAATLLHSLPKIDIDCLKKAEKAALP